MMRAGLALLVALAGCDALPRDPDGTSTRVTDGRRFAVGIAGPLAPADQMAATALLDRIAAATGARPVAVADAAEPLLLQLEAGEIDLVIGRFAEPSPWAKRVHMTEPLRRIGGGEAALQLVAATANGENRWIMTVDRAARAAGGVR